MSYYYYSHSLEENCCEMLNMGVERGGGSVNMLKPYFFCQMLKISSKVFLKLGFSSWYPRLLS